MPDGHGPAVWEVVASKLYDRGDPANGAEEIPLAEAPEAEARRVYNDTVAEAGEHGYAHVTLRCNGEVVESWPQETGWTV